MLQVTYLPNCSVEPHQTPPVSTRVSRPFRKIHDTFRDELSLGILRKWDPVIPPALMTIQIHRGSRPLYETM